MKGDVRQKKNNGWQNLTCRDTDGWQMEGNVFLGNFVCVWGLYKEAQLILRCFRNKVVLKIFIWVYILQPNCLQDIQPLFLHNACKTWPVSLQVLYKGNKVVREYEIWVYYNPSSSLCAFVFFRLFFAGYTYSPWAYLRVAHRSLFDSSQFMIFVRLLAFRRIMQRTAHRV